MINPSYYTRELLELKNYNKPLEYLIELGADTLLSFIKYDGRKIAYIDINHADGDSIGSSVNLAFLFDMKNVHYNIGSHNSSYKLTFSFSNLPLDEIKANLKREIKMLYIVTDCTPYSLFWKDIEEISRQSKAREYFHVLVIDHHPFIGREEAKGVIKTEENECLTYLNFGHSKEANEWWRGPNIPCSGEITFYIVLNILLDKLKESNEDKLRHILVPTLLATYTDLRTRQFIESIKDEKIRNVIENHTRGGPIDKYKGSVTFFDSFIEIFNGAIRYAGLKVVNEFRTHSLTENQKVHCPTHKLLKLAAANVMSATKIGDPATLTIYPRDLGYEGESGHGLREILYAYSEWENIKPVAKNAFFRYAFDHYEPRTDRVIHFDDTKSIIAILPQSQVKVSYKKDIIDLSKLLKYPPYVEYFFTSYYHIANIEIVKNSNLIIVGIESSKDEDYAEFSFRSNNRSIPAGLFASQIANNIRNELQCTSDHVLGGGHESAAGLRIRQDIFDRLKKEYNINIYSLMNELIKDVRI